jgi:protein SCO1/2
MVVVAIVAAAGPSGTRAAQERRYPVTGMVTRVEPESRRFTVSHEDIPGFMSGMIMPFEVRQASELAAIAPGALIEFTLVIGPDAGYATAIRVRRWPLAATRAPGRRDEILPGQLLPAVTFTDQSGQAFAIPAAAAGRVAVVDFIYTRCALPQFCLRQSETFAALQRRFARQYGNDLLLLSVTFDPEHDSPGVLATYAGRYGADPKMWRFLTGRRGDVARWAARAGVGRYPEEGLKGHSLRTLLIDRRGRVAARVEGNQYPAQQIGDLVLDLLGREER